MRLIKKGGGAAADNTTPRTMLDGLLGHWPLETNGNDSLGLHNLTGVGSPTFADSTLYLDGSQWMQSGHRFELRAGFTAACWITPEASSGYSPALAQWMMGRSGFSFIASTSEDTTTFSVSNNLGAATVRPAILDTYQFIAVTYDGMNQTLWRDGVPQGSTTAGPIVDASEDDAQFMVGSLDYGGEFTYQGYIHHVALFNRPLNRAQVLALFNEGAPLPFASYATTSA